MVKIRLSRIGKKKVPFYKVVVSDSRTPADGRFIEQIGTYDPVKGQFFTWLKTIARNTGLDFIDSEAKVHPKDQIVYLDDGGDVSGVEKIASPGKNPLDSIISDEEHEKTVGYVTRLPELYRTVAMKRVIDGMKYNEIAEDLGMGLNTVKTRIKRAKAMVDRMRADDEGK